MDKSPFGADALSIEAVVTASKMNGGKNCAAETCTMSAGRCSDEGCLLFGYGAKEVAQYQRLNFGRLD